MPKRIKKRIKSIPTKSDLKVLKEELKLEEELVKLHVAFRNQLATFITGAFAFVAALLWRDAIQSFLTKYAEIIKSIIPWKELWVIQLFTALAVSLLAVLAIVIVSRVLKVEAKK